MTISNLLKKYNFRPNKRLGQNFLIDQKVLQKIIKAADLTKEDTVLEIGPGLGILTQALAQIAKKVIAVEKDQKMIEVLKIIIGEYKNIEIIESDILKLKEFYLKDSYKIVANLPYYISSPVIRQFLESKNPPYEMTLLVQKEVAQRICSQPPDMSVLAVSVQFYANPKIISYVSKKSFWPQPKVNSAILKIKNIKHPKLNIKHFFQVVKAGFLSPRKQLANNLSKGLDVAKDKIYLICKKIDINPSRRAETLTIEEWKKISKNI